MEYDELVQRLREWADTHSFSAVPRAAADAITALQARVAELKSANDSFASESICHMDRNDPHFCPKAPCDYCLQYQRQRAERAEADIAAARNAYEMQRQDCINLTEKVIPNIREDLAAARADAERYRWLRQNPTWIGFDSDYQAEFIDNAVDAALAGKDAT